jgi:hypothetical protein
MTKLPKLKSQVKFKKEFFHYFSIKRKQINHSINHIFKQNHYLH